MGDPVPPMFWFRDPDGNSLLIVEAAYRPPPPPRLARMRGASRGARAHGSGARGAPAPGA